MQCGSHLLHSYLILLRMGFTLPQTVTSCAVRSYRTLSPLPNYSKAIRRSSLCCTCRQLTLPRRYLASYPLEPGLSSTHPKTSRDYSVNSHGLVYQLETHPRTRMKRKLQKHYKVDLSKEMNSYSI